MLIIEVGSTESTFFSVVLFYCDINELTCSALCANFAA